MRAFLISAIVVLTLITAPYQPMGGHCSGALHAQMLAAQQRPQNSGEPVPMPLPGNPGHTKPADGAYCKISKHPADSCNCHRKCALDKDGQVQLGIDGNPMIAEDRKCRAYCFLDHCHCPIRECP